MDATHHWPFAREYSIWNATVTALQFWMADLEPQTSVMQLRNISEEVLFSHFVTALNDTFEQELSLEDKGYDRGSGSLNIPSLLHRTPHLYCISTGENLSFRSATPLTN